MIDQTGEAPVAARPPWQQDLVVEFRMSTPFEHSGSNQCRDVAQPGRALAWGARGRQFKSARPDQKFHCSPFGNLQAHPSFTFELHPDQ